MSSTKAAARGATPGRARLKGQVGGADPARTPHPGAPNTERGVRPTGRATRSEATRAGMQAAKAAGKHVGRPASEVATDPAVIALIAKERAKGNSYRLIAADLDALGLPTPGGANRWRAAIRSRTT